MLHNYGVQGGVMGDEQNKIDEKTLIPIYSIGLVVICILWLSNIHFKANASEKEIDELKLKMTVVEKIDRRLARIEGALKINTPEDEK